MPSPITVLLYSSEIDKTMKLTMGQVSEAKCVAEQTEQWVAEQNG